MNVIRAIVKLNQEITQFGKVRCFQEGNLMTGHHFVKKSEDSRDTSFVQVESCLLLHMPFLS